MPKLMRFIDLAIFLGSLGALVNLLYPRYCPQQLYLVTGIGGLMVRALLYLFGVAEKWPDLKNFHYGFEYCSFGSLLYWAGGSLGLALGAVIAGLVLQIVEYIARHGPLAPPS